MKAWSSYSRLNLNLHWRNGVKRMPPYTFVLAFVAALFLLCVFCIIRFTALAKLIEYRKLVDALQERNVLLEARNEELLRIQEQLSLTNMKLERLAVTDGLTGCFNRRYLNQYLKHEVMLNQHDQLAFSIILFDIDRFKSINDTYGHLIGDEVLKSTADVVKRSLRADDMMARYGGEEFTIFLPNTIEGDAYQLAQRIRRAVETNVVFSEKGPIQVTISVGYVSIHPGIKMPTEPEEYLNQLFSWADAALYKAKHGGRNQIVQGG